MDIPQNIVKAIVSLRTGDDEAIESVRQENQTSGYVLEGYVSQEIMEKRRKFFRQELIAYTYKHYRAEKRELEECNPEVAETIEPDEDLREWPEFFDVDETP